MRVTIFRSGGSGSRATVVRKLDDYDIPYGRDALERSREALRNAITSGVVVLAGDYIITIVYADHSSSVSTFTVNEVATPRLVIA